MVWTIVLAIVGVIGLFIQFYIYILPRWRKNKGKTLEDKEIVREELLRSIEDAKNYKWVSFPASGALALRILSDVTKDARLSKRLCDELTQLEEEIAQEYNRWLRECQQVIETEIKLRSKSQPVIEATFSSVFVSPTEYSLRYLEESPVYSICRAIFRGDLTFGIVRDSVLKDYGDLTFGIDRDSVVRDYWDKQTLKELVEAKDFHAFIEGLQKLQERESIKALRDAQAKFIEKAQLILKEVS